MSFTTVKKLGALALGIFYIAMPVSSKADEFDDYAKVCNAFMKMNEVAECKFKAPRTLIVSMSTGGKEAALCPLLATTISHQAADMRGKGWTLELWTPYSRTAVYKCPI